MSGKKPIVVVGSINTDLVVLTKRIPAVGETVIGTDFQTHPGGKGANQAVAVSRLGYPVKLIGCVGSDAFGLELKSHLKDAGVDIEGVRSTEGASGVASIIVSSAGENSIVVAPGANSLVTPHYLEAHINILRQAGMVLVQLEIPIETVECLATICARENIPLMMDPAPAMELPAGVFESIAWFTPNQTEAQFYTAAPGDRLHGAPEIAARLLAKGCRGVVLKIGAEGSYLASCEGLNEFVPALQVKAVDTTAAGDAFNGGFATGLMMGKSPLAAAKFASAVAGISVTRKGAQPSMPTLSEVEKLA